MKNVDEKQMVVRCTWCEHIFPENKILVKNIIGTVDTTSEFCPDCGQNGHLMDIGIYGKEDDKVLFPYLSKTKDWKFFKNYFSADTLCYFENEIQDYEESVDDEEKEDYPTIIQWWEGLMDFKDLLEVYN